jgi:hypothetical protein
MAHLYLMEEAWVGVPGVKPPILLSQKIEKACLHLVLWHCILNCDLLAS